MRNIIIAVLLMFTSSVFAMNAIEQQLKESPQMSKFCVNKIEYYEKKVLKYQAIPKEKRRKSWKVKITYYAIQLEEWKSYCNGEEED